MKKLVIVCATLIGVNAAAAQPYTVPPSFSFDAMPGFVPATPPSGGAFSGGAYGGVPGGGYGYNWREQRGDNDWRNNTWREDRFDSDWRNNNWQTRRELRDWRQRDDYARLRNPDSQTDQGLVECGRGSVGSAGPCTGGSYVTINPTQRPQTAQSPGQTPGTPGTPETPSTPGTGNAGNYDRASAAADERSRSSTTRGVADCGHGAVWRRCQ